MTDHLRFVLSLMTQENDYQMEEASEAERICRELGIELQVLYADNDAVRQSQQLLDEILTKGDRPNAIIVQPVGTSLLQVAHAATHAGIGWAVLNREVEYLEDLRREKRAPAFEVVTDNVEIGRIQGRQLSALLPNGGRVLYIEGPASNPAAQQRKQGVLELKPANIELRSVRSSQWDRGHVVTAIEAWLRLSTSHDVKYDLIAAQSDTLAMGVRDAIDSMSNPAERSYWKQLQLLGCDGSKGSGEVWVNKGLLRATVRRPILAGKAITLMQRALSGQEVDGHTLLIPESYPDLNTLKPLTQLAHT